MDKATPSGPGKKQIFYGSQLGQKCKSARKGKVFDGILKISIIVRRPTNLNSEIPVLVSRVFSSSPHTRTGHRSTSSQSYASSFFLHSLSSDHIDFDWQLPSAPPQHGPEVLKLHWCQVTEGCQRMRICQERLGRIGPKPNRLSCITWVLGKRHNPFFLLTRLS